MKITKSDIKILVDLYNSVDGLTPYVFYQRHKYGPETVYKAISKFIGKGYILTEQDKLIITKVGREFVEQKRFNFDENKFDRIPKEFLVPKLAINEPYLPNVTKLSKKILNLQKNGDGQETCT